MPKFIDQTGKRFGRLVVQSHEGRNANLKQLWKCQCDCGNLKIVTTQELNAGDTKSCGCIIPNFKHGGWDKSSYNTWRGMMRRCNNPKDKDYPRYGAKGIIVCPKWSDYATFVADMGEPQGSETLDRVDPYGNYTPENCRWATLIEQARNKRPSKTNTSGHIGVINVYKNKWMAKITANKKSFYSQVFNTIEEAVNARKTLEQKHWGIS